MTALKVAATFGALIFVSVSIAGAAEDPCELMSKTGESTVTNDCIACVPIGDGKTKQVGAWCTVSGGGSKTDTSCVADVGQPPGTCKVTYCTPDGKCLNASQNKVPPKDAQHPKSEEELKKIYDDQLDRGTSIAELQKLNSNNLEGPAGEWLQESLQERATDPTPALSQSSDDPFAGIQALANEQGVQVTYNPDGTISDETYRQLEALESSSLAPTGEDSSYGPLADYALKSYPDTFGDGSVSEDTSKSWWERTWEGAWEGLQDMGVAVRDALFGGPAVAGQMRFASTYGWDAGSGDSSTQRLAGGGTLDNYPYTIANHDDPFGTRYKITNPSTRESVVGEVRDRGPYVRVKGGYVPHPTRKADVSKTIAQEIGMGRTVTNLRFEKVPANTPLGPVEPALASTEPSGPPPPLPTRPPAGATVDFVEGYPGQGTLPSGFEGFNEGSTPYPYIDWSKVAYVDDLDVYSGLYPSSPPQSQVDSSPEAPGVGPIAAGPTYQAPAPTDGGSFRSAQDYGLAEGIQLATRQVLETSRNFVEGYLGQGTQPSGYEGFNYGSVPYDPNAYYEAGENLGSAPSGRPSIINWSVLRLDTTPDDLDVYSETYARVTPPTSPQPSALPVGVSSRGAQDVGIVPSARSAQDYRLDERVQLSRELVLTPSRNIAEGYGPGGVVGSGYEGFNEGSTPYIDWSKVAYVDDLDVYSGLYPPSPPQSQVDSSPAASGVGPIAAVQAQPQGPPAPYYPSSRLAPTQPLRTRSIVPVAPSSPPAPALAPVTPAQPLTPSLVQALPGSSQTSIVDFLDYNGFDSSAANRALLAQAVGITGYDRSAAMNTELLRRLSTGGIPDVSPALPVASPSRPALDALPMNVPPVGSATTPYQLWGSSLPPVSTRRSLYDQLVQEGFAPSVVRYSGTEQQNLDLLQALRRREAYVRSYPQI